MWKSDFFLLVHRRFHKFFIKGMEIYQWPTLILTHTGILILDRCVLFIIDQGPWEATDFLTAADFQYTLKCFSE